MCVIKTQLKALLRSGWMAVMLAPLILVGLLYSFQGFGVASLANEGQYMLVLFNLLLLELGVYLNHSIRDLELSLQSKTKLYLEKICSGYLFGAIGLLVPMLYFCIQAVLVPVEFGILWGYFRSILLSWLIPLLVLIPMGFLLGLLVGGKAAYLVAIFLSFLQGPFFTVFIESHLYRLTESSAFCAVLNLLNLSYDNPTTVPIYFGGATLNQGTWWNLLCYVLLAGALILLILCVRNPMFRRRHICVVCGILLLAGAWMGGKSYIDAAPQLIDPDYRSGEVDPFPEKIRPLATRGEYTSLQIDHYGMDLSLTEKFQNVCTIGLTNVGNYPFQQDLEMNLDETLRVTSVVISGHPVSYSQEGDRLRIEDLSLQPQERTELQISCAGRINYMDYLHIRMVYVDDTSACLPEMFCWYPQLENGQERMAYELKIASKNPVISNLQASEGDAAVFTGNAQRVCLYSGYLETREIDGKLVTASPFLWRSYACQARLNHIVQEYEWDENGRGMSNLPMVYEYEYTQEEVRAQVTHYLIAPITYNSIFRSYIYDHLGVVAEPIYTY